MNNLYEKFSRFAVRLGIILVVILLLLVLVNVVLTGNFKLLFNGIIGCGIFLILWIGLIKFVSMINGR